MIELIFVFSVGILVGFVLMFCYHLCIHKTLLSLDQKYNRILTLMSEWQKKI